jgi:CBS domain containing-hemolysin-like protein
VDEAGQFGFATRIAVTLFFVFLNGFFVAAEFALVKVGSAQLAQAAARGSRRAEVAQHVHGQLSLYLSACQLGITIASLILGWIAEPAVAQFLLVGAEALGFDFARDDPFLHAVALALALAIVTGLHMTLGEQVPKLWAIHHAEQTALSVAYPLRLFTNVLRPVIWLLNAISNAMLRLAGLSAAQIAEASSHSAQEIKWILAQSGDAGHLQPRQVELARNVIEIIDLQARHILVPRVDVVFLSLQNSLEENLRIVRESGHSRFPLCNVGLDTVQGIVHAKEVLLALAEDRTPDLKAFAREALFVPDSQPLSRLILQLQRTGRHCCVVVDEHGTAIGLAFLEDALEEIVGPIRDEFDPVPEDVTRLPSGAVELPGNLPLPEAVDLLQLKDLEEEADTIGGLIVAQLGRLARQGDTIEIPGYRVSVLEVVRRRVARLRFEPCEHAPAPIK